MRRSKTTGRFLATKRHKPAQKPLQTLPVVANPYAAMDETKASASFQLFRDLLGTRDNLDREGTEQLLKKFGNNTSWIYVCCTRIANALAQIPFQVWDRTKMDQPNPVVTSYDRGLNDLIRQPNPFQRRFDFMEALSISLELTGNAFCELVRDKNGLPFEMYVLNPSRVTIVPDPKTFIKGYVYTVNARHIMFPRDNIIHIKYHHPANDYYGFAPLTAARVAADTDFAAINWNRTFLLRGSWPAGAIETDADLGEVEIKRLQRVIKQTMQAGADQAGRLLLLTGGLKYNKLAVTPKESDWLDSRKMARDEILSIFGVPFAIAGLNSGEQTTARSAGVEQQIKQFYRNTIFPKMEKILAAFNLALIPNFREKYELRPDYRHVPALQEEVEQELTRAMALRTLVTAGLSLNKAMTRLYTEIEPEPWGDVAWMNSAMVPVDGPEAPAPPTKPTGAIPPDNANPNGNPPQKQLPFGEPEDAEYQRILARVTRRGIGVKTEP